MDEILNYWKDYAGPEALYPRIFVVRDADRVIACASVAPRTVGTSLGDLTVMCLARVCSAQEYRGRRLGDAVVREAFKLVDGGLFKFSLFQTKRNVRPFYERFGAVAVENKFTNSLADDPRANPFWDEIAMRYPGGAGWPMGEIDLRGPGW